MFSAMRSHADEIAVERAKVAVACHHMSRAEVAQIIRHYGAKLAGLSLCLRGDELAAAAERLRSERDAAIRVARASWRARRRDQMARTIRSLIDGRSRARMRHRARGQAVAEEFRKAAQAVVTADPRPTLRRPTRQRVVVIVNAPK
jgi:hypothetical protein